jgi:hypothetical protein
MGSIMSTNSNRSLSNNHNNKLVLLLALLPFQGFRRFLGYLGVLDAIRLYGCSRSLRNTIRNDTAFWQRLYRVKFLFGPYTIKELDFVYWCARTGSSTATAPSTNTSDVLNTLDWHDTYRRRVRTENNWVTTLSEDSMGYLALFN